MKLAIFAPLFIALLVGGFWITNLVKLTNCDFAAPYRCEMLHGVGLIPPIAFFTAWLDSDNS